MRTFLTFLIILFTIFPLYSQWSHQANINTPVCLTQQDQIYPMLTSNGTNGAIMGWIDMRDKLRKIYLANFDSEGINTWLDNGISISFSTQKQFYPVLAGSRQGDVYVAWEESNSIYCQKIDNDGTKMWGDYGREIYTNDRQQQPNIYFDNDSSLYVVWPSQDAQLSFISVLKINRSGKIDSSWKETGLIITKKDIIGKVYPCMTTDLNNGVIVTWIEGNRILAKRISSSGIMLSDSAGVALTAELEGLTKLQIISDFYSSIYVLWTVLNSSNTYSLFAQRIDSNAAKLWDDEGILVSQSLSNPTPPYAIFDTNNELIFCWEDSSENNTTINVQKLSRSGVMRWEPSEGIPISNRQNHATNPTIARIGGGELLVAWEQEDNIFAQRIDSTGTVIWNDNGLLVSSAPGIQSSPKIIGDNQGGGIIVWEDYRDDATGDIYIQRIDSLGFLGKDYDGPQISHTPIAEVLEFDDIKINASIIDSLAGVKFSQIRWKKSDAQLFYSVDMYQTEGKLFSGTIPGDSVAIGEISYFIYAEDKYKNISKTDTFEINIFRNMPPTIFHLEPNNPVENEPIEIITSVFDSMPGVKNVEIYYKVGGRRNFDVLPMNRLQNSLFSVNLPGGNITNQGFAYYFSAVDNLDAIAHSDTFSFNIAISNIEKSTSQQPEKYELISFPIIPEDSSSLKLLADDLGNYDNRYWRLYQVLPATEQYMEYGNEAFHYFPSGIGAWLITRESKKIDTDAGTTNLTNHNYRIHLNKGWNIIGNPFNFPVDWADVKKVDVHEANFDYVNGEYKNAQQLIPWKAYLIYSWHDSGYVDIPPLESQTILKSSTQQAILPGLEFILQLKATCQNAIDNRNFIGVTKNASNNKDNLDMLEPMPPPGNFVSLYFPNYDWEEFGNNYSIDIRPTFQEGMIWNFEVNTNLFGSPVKLSFDSTNTIPVNFSIYLIDNSTQFIQDVRKNTHYSYVSPKTTQNRSFKLVIGTEDFFQKQQIQLLNIPRSYVLYQNFPNPFNSSTEIRYALPQNSIVTLKIFNILGEEISKLINNKFQEAGKYNIIWNSVNELNNKVSGGIYFCQLITTNSKIVKTIKLVYLK